MWGINIQVRCHYCICKILFLAHEHILSHTAPPCEGNFVHTTNHQKSCLFAAGFFTKACPTPQRQVWGSDRKGVTLQKNEQNQQECGTGPWTEKQQSWEHAASTHSIKSSSSHWNRVLGNWISTPEMHWATQYKCFCIMEFDFRILWIQE